MIKNHEVNLNKTLKYKNFQEIKLYKMAILNCFKKKLHFLTFLPNNVIKLKNKIYVVLIVSVSLFEKQIYDKCNNSENILMGKFSRE